jgi:hypothetical protein
MITERPRRLPIDNYMLPDELGVVTAGGCLEK